MKSFKEYLTEAKDKESHVSVIPLVGFSPFSHDGHRIDLGDSLSKLPGKKVVGMSQKADHFSPKERANILKRQWGSGFKVHHSVSGGATIAHAYDSMPEGKKHLHILVGHDRKALADGLKKSLEAGTIKEMGTNKFDSVTIHHPENQDRKHGMSGTNMRKAANDGHIEDFHKHLGPNFSRTEAHSLMKRVKDGIDAGKIKLKR